LTSLYAVLRGLPVLTRDYRESQIRIAFRPRDALFEVSDAAIQRDPEFIYDISTLWTKGASSYKLVKDFLTKLRRSKEVAADEEELISS